VACGDVDECDRVECRVEVSFHGDMPSNKVNGV
jgi:hypothetical protein